MMCFQFRFESIAGHFEKAKIQSPMTLTSGNIDRIAHAREKPALRKMIEIGKAIKSI